MANEALPTTVTMPVVEGTGSSVNNVVTFQRPVPSVLRAKGMRND
jgi:hypothetical protein